MRNAILVGLKFAIENIKETLMQVVLLSAIISK